MTRQETLEESVLQAVDALSEQSADQVTKIVADLFKSAVLKKYKDAFDQELAQGRVQKKNIDKGVDYCYSDIIVSIRKLPQLRADEKEGLIRKAKQMKNLVRKTVERILIDKGIEIKQ